MEQYNERRLQLMFERDEMIRQIIRIDIDLYDDASSKLIEIRKDFRRELKTLLLCMDRKE